MSPLILLMALLPASQATPGFPSAIMNELGAPCEPACSLCHSGTASPGTANTRFARAMLSRGLRAGDDAGVADVLAELTADEVDSDGDGTPDTQEIASGQDPNPDGVVWCGMDLPSYGCLDQSASGAALLAVLPAFGLCWSRGRGRSIPI